MLTKLITFLSNPDNGDKLVVYTCALAAVALVVGGAAIWRKHGKKIEEDIDIIVDAGKKLK